MVVKFGKEKYLDISSARRSETGDIEVLSSNYDTADCVYLVEHNCNWFVVLEHASESPDELDIDRFHPYLIENQLDVYRLNAAL